MIFLLLAIWIASGEPFAEVQVRGNVRVPEASILHYLGAVDSDDLESAFRRLFDTGLFTDIRFETEETPEGLRLVVIVEEKPLLRSVRFTGDVVREVELREAMDLERWLNRPFAAQEGAELADAAEVFLGPGHVVELRFEEPDEGRVDLTLHIEREELPRIESIAFVGNDRVSDGELRDVMRLKSSGLLSRLARTDRFAPDRLEEDLERLREFLRRRGFAAARVGPGEVEAIDGPSVRITIPVEEGEIFRFGLVVIEPGPLFDPEKARFFLPLGGDRFDGSAIDRAAERLAARYRDRGYPTVVVDRDERLRPEERLADIALRVSPGPFFTVDRITFEGNERHDDEELRIFLDLHEGEAFRESELEAGVRALMSLGHFQNVGTEVDVFSTPGRARVVYHVEETEPFEYLLGGGLDGVQGGSGTGQLIARGIVGRAETMELELDLGNRFQSFAFTYREPSIFSRRIFLDASFRRADLTYPDETSEDTTDVALRVGGPAGARWRLLSSVRLSDFTLGSSLDGDVAFLTPFLGERFRTVRSTAILAFDDRDRPFFTSRGLGADLAYEWVTGDVRLHRARGRASLFVPLDRERRTVLSVSGQAEAIWPYGSPATRGLPRFERLFLGSENDLRGFSIRGVGPRDDDVVVGGDRLVQASLEILRELGPRLRLVAFFDAGNVWATDFEGLPLPEVRYDAGGEARLLAPLANLPVRIGYGVNLNRVEGESPGRFFVSLALRF